MLSFFNRSRLIAFLILTLISSLIQIPVTVAEANAGVLAESLKPGAVVRRGSEFQILIKLKTGCDQADLNLLNERIGGRQVSSSPKLAVIRVNVRGDVAEALNLYKASGLVEYAEPNCLRRAAGIVPNDQFYSDQWGLKQIGMEDAWASLGSNIQTVKVAILDTGVDASHEDLQGVFAMNPDQSGQILGKHFYTDTNGRQASDDKIQDNAGHGTHIAGIIGALANNNKGVAGISSRAKIMPVKVLDDVGYGDDANIAQGLIWAVDNGARVVNMSLAGPTQSKTLAEAIKYAKDKGTVIVAATGNDGTSDPNYPAAYDGVIGVGATDNKDIWMQESNYGSSVDVSAPGVSILSTYPSNKSENGLPYEINTGTSMAAGFVSGLAAMLLSKNSSITADQVEGIMMLSAADLGQAGWDDYYGYGRIDAARAIKLGSEATKPTVSINTPFDGTKIEDKYLTISATATDTDSGIAFVDFSVNGERVGSSATQPYQVTIQTERLNGLNTIRAAAYDKNGNSSIREVKCYKQSFADVSPSYWAFQDIESLSSGKILTGYPDKSFKPGNFVGRAEFVKMLIEGLGMSKKTSYSGYFKDVPKTYWAWPYIEAAYDMGLVNGYTDTQFAPESKIKRVEMATILIKTGAFTIDYSGSSFNDVMTNYWGFVYVMSAKNAGIIGGYPGNVFRPETVMSRAEAAKVINKSFVN